MVQVRTDLVGGHMDVVSDDQCAGGQPGLEQLQHGEIEVLPPIEQDDTTVPSAGRRFTVRGPEDVPLLLGPLLLDRLDRTSAVVLRFVAEGDESYDDLRHGTVDIDIGVQHDLPPDIESATLAVVRLVGVVRSDHPILRTKRVSVKEFVSHPHIEVSRRGRNCGPLDLAVEALGFSRTVQATVPSSGLALALARATDAVAVVPALTVPSGPGLSTFELPVESATVPKAMAWHRRFSTDSDHVWIRTIVLESVGSD